jgi:hypothetical protein
MAFQQYPQKLGIPSGDTAGRPAGAVEGDTYYNGELGLLEIYSNEEWIPCSAPAGIPTVVGVDVGTSRAYGNGAITITFTAGTNGGSPYGYVGTAVIGALTYTTGATTATTVTLSVGDSGTYALSGTAYNGFGTSPSSVPSNLAITTVPQAPTIGTATDKQTLNTGGELSLTFTAGNTGGKSITNYKYSTDGSTYTAFSPAQTTSPLTISGLTNGTSYTVRLKAVNDNGDSSASSASNSATPTASFSYDYLIVAGGGSGGTSEGGGGGAGGLLTSTATVTTATTYAVVVGAGGAVPGTDVAGINGGSSSFGAISATGGGGGGSTTGSTSGRDGGSGGGPRRDGAGATGGSGISGQGFRGGIGGAASYASGAGGGGAGAVGGNGSAQGGSGAPNYGDAAAGGAGGVGVASSITGTSVFYAGGGGGACYSEAGGTQGRSAGGNGGGGQGGFGGSGGAPDGLAGTENRGGGGGGGRSGSGGSGGVGGAGGSGVVILKYPDTRTISIGAGLTGTTATTGSFKVTTITAGSGNVSWS